MSTDNHETISDVELAFQEEKIEGLDGAEDSGLGDYPIDTFLIRK